MFSFVSDHNVLTCVYTNVRLNHLAKQIPLPWQQSKPPPFSGPLRQEVSLQGQEVSLSPSRLPLALPTLPEPLQGSIPASLPQPLALTGRPPPPPRQRQTGVPIPVTAGPRSALPTQRRALRFPLKGQVSLQIGLSRIKKINCVHIKTPTGQFCLDRVVYLFSSVSWGFTPRLQLSWRAKS